MTNHQEERGEANFVQAGEIVACGHCQPDKGFDMPEKYGVTCTCKCHTPSQGEPWVAEFHKTFTGPLYPELESFIQKTLEADRADLLEELEREVEGMKNHQFINSGTVLRNETLEEVQTLLRNKQK